MKKLLFLNLILLVLFYLVGCSRGKTERSSISTDTSFFADRNYLYKNINNTLQTKAIWRRTKDDKLDSHIYADSSYKTTYVELNHDQKLQLIGPFISKLLKVDKKYVADFMEAYFISKQSKIGKLQPLIFYINGDDYTSKTLILLDRHYKPVGGLNLEGGFNSGPTDMPDSSIQYEAKSYSYLDRNKITTIRITYTESTIDSLKKPTQVDSDVFISLINPSGKITTRKALTRHYSIPYSSLQR